MNIQKIREELRTALANKDMSYVLKGSIFTAFAMVIVQVLRFGGGMIIGRHYGPEIHGELRLLTTLVSSVVILTNFGIKDAMLRLIPEYREKENLATSWAIYRKGVSYTFIFSLIGSGLILMITPWLAEHHWNVPHLKPIFLLAAAFVFPLLLDGLNMFTLRALFHIRQANLLRIAVVSARLVALLVVTYYFYHHQAPLYIYLFVLCGFSALLSSATIFKFFFRPSRKLKPTNVPTGGDLMALAFPMLMTYASFLINDKTDTWMLQAFGKGAAQVGIYGACLNLANMGRMIMIALNTTVQPKFSQLFHAGKMDEVQYIAQKSSKMITLLNIPIFLALTFGAPYLLWFYGGQQHGAEYMTGAMALAILATGQMINTAAGPTAQLLNVTGHHKQFRNIAFIGAIANVIMNFFLIPKYGILGAAIASAISMAGWNIIASFYIKRKFGFFIGYLPFLRK
ncbi:MAG: flippase [Bacteroidetes bacterium]|nr:flippase [Bacteroidota bacterium]